MDWNSCIPSTLATPTSKNRNITMTPDNLQTCKITNVIHYWDFVIITGSGFLVSRSARPVFTAAFTTFPFTQKKRSTDQCSPNASDWTNQVLYCPRQYSRVRVVLSRLHPVLCIGSGVLKDFPQWSINQYCSCFYRCCKTNAVCHTCHRHWGDFRVVPFPAPPVY